MWSNVTHFQSVTLETVSENDAEDFERSEIYADLQLLEKKKKNCHLSPNILT